MALSDINKQKQGALAVSSIQMGLVTHEVK